MPQRPVAVDGRDLLPPENLYARFENTSGKIVELSVGPNADGSEAEMCGNGIRAFFKYLRDHGDTDGNGKLDVLDVAAIIDAGKFNNPAAGAASWAAGDFNGDDLVSVRRIHTCRV